MVDQPHRASDTRLLIIDTTPQLYLDLIGSRFPELRIECCGFAGEQTAAVDRVQPQVVLSFKLKGMTPASQSAVFAGDPVRWVQVAGAGIDHLPSWDATEVTVTNSSGVLGAYMAEYVVGSIMMVNFGFHRYIHQMRQHSWQAHLWSPLTGRTLLVIGLGRIGKRVATMAKSLGMHVLGVKASTSVVPEVDHQLPLERLHDALARADFVTIHVPLTDNTRHLIDARALTHMKSTAWLINASRGPVVSETALIQALKQGTIAGAVLDVFDTEPLPQESPLWDLENVVITPHVGDSIDGWQRRMAEFFCDNLQRWLSGQALLNTVDPASRY